MKHFLLFLLGIFLLSGSAMFVLLSSDAVRTWTVRRWNLLRGAWQTAGLLLIAALIAGGFYAAAKEQIIFHEEATVLSTAAAFLHGQPIYPFPSDPVEYVAQYGPATYFVLFPPLLAGAGHIGEIQAWSVLALVGAFVFLHLALKRFGSWTAIAAVGYMALFTSMRCDNVWAIKGDVWILLFAALGLWASLEWEATAAAIGVALSGAMLIDIKITTGFLAILPLVLMWGRGSRHRRAAVGSLVLMGVLVVLPFALPHISAAAYLQQLLEAGDHGFSPGILRVNVRMAIMMCLPLVTLLWAAFRQHAALTRQFLARRALFFAIVAFSFVVAIITGSKNGAGPWHLLGITIPVAFLCAETWQIVTDHKEPATWLSSRLAPFYGVVLVLYVMAAQAVAGGIRERRLGLEGMIYAPPRAVESDVLALIRQYPGAAMQMGFSDNAHYEFTFVRPVLQEHGSPLFIDPNARNDADLLNVPVSQAVLDRLKSCSIDLWLIPKGGEPFSMESLYAEDPSVHGRVPFHDLYPENFREAFLATYEPVPSESRYFNLWACRAHPFHASTDSTHS